MSICITTKTPSINKQLLISIQLNKQEIFELIALILKLNKLNNYQLKSVH